MGQSVCGFHRSDAIGVSIGSHGAVRRPYGRWMCIGSHFERHLPDGDVRDFLRAVVVIITMLIAARLIYRRCPTSSAHGKEASRYHAQNVSDDQTFVGAPGRRNQHFNMMRDRGIAWMVIIGIIATVLVAILHLWAILY